MADLRKIEFEPNWRRKRFTALLCGVGNEVTADEYIGFVLEKNQNASIWIIDLGDEQIRAVREMVNAKYKDKSIVIRKTDALELGKLIANHSVDWIETDAVWEFFDYSGLERLLNVWKMLLRREGFITTSATSYESNFEKRLSKIEAWIGKTWLGVNVFGHERVKLNKLIRVAGFRFYERPSLTSYFRRYVMAVRVKK